MPQFSLSGRRVDQIDRLDVLPLASAMTISFLKSVESFLAPLCCDSTRHLQFAPQLFRRLGEVFLIRVLGDRSDLAKLVANQAGGQLPYDRASTVANSQVSHFICALRQRNAAGFGYDLRDTCAMRALLVVPS